MTYKTYLQQKKYSKTTITYYQKRVAEFIQWAENRQESPSTMSYQSCMYYLKYLQQKQLQPQTINRHLTALRHYYTYVLTQSLRKDNPLENVVIKGTVRKVFHTLLDADELEELYLSLIHI